jgi:hypothetical protein
MNCTARACPHGQTYLAGQVGDGALLRPFDWVRITTAELDQPNVGVIHHLYTSPADGVLWADVTTSYRQYSQHPLADLEPLPHRATPKTTPDVMPAEVNA